jgi:hypothetical protein
MNAARVTNRALRLVDRLRVLYVDPDDAAKFTIEPSCPEIGRTPPIRRNRRSRNSRSVIENLLRLHRLHAGRMFSMLFDPPRQIGIR